MDKCVIIVDNSNIWIEGKKHSARQKGASKKEDSSWRIDFGKLLSVIADNNEIYKAIFVGSEPPKNDSIWNAAKIKGFEVKTYKRNIANKEKAVDTELAVQGTEIICTAPEPCILKLLSGDSDFIPLINIASKRNWKPEIWAFSNALNEHGEMAKAADSVKYLDTVFEQISLDDKKAQTTK